MSFLSLPIASRRKADFVVCALCCRLGLSSWLPCRCAQVKFYTMLVQVSANLHVSCFLSLVICLRFSVSLRFACCLPRFTVPAAARPLSFRERSASRAARRLSSPPLVVVFLLLIVVLVVDLFVCLFACLLRRSSYAP